MGSRLSFARCALFTCLAILLSQSAATAAANEPIGRGSDLACLYLNQQIAREVLGEDPGVAIIASQSVSSCTYLTKHREVNLVMLIATPEDRAWRAAAGKNWCDAHPRPPCPQAGRRFAQTSNPSELYTLIRGAFGPSATPFPGLKYPAIVGPDRKVYVGTKGALAIFQSRERASEYAQSWTSRPDLAKLAAELVIK